MKPIFMNISMTILFVFLSITVFSQTSEAKMEQFLQEKRAYNLNNNEVFGYRIQLFNGISETGARNAQARFIGLFPEVSTKLFFEQPEWKVQVGNYYTKLEAFKALQEIQKEFAGAFLLKTKIKIN